ncbi:endonuclease/exonuclease/phosphatase family protein [Pelagicoccus mobilis]|uniref:Endonuclease/exonuclease/phosphatase family protein n=1 Tax=Pelagicoccus mobilis TaxID=415221 RepID=A0A934RWI0_9BACT|nr:endonuclease/exonuclease/phosphatase family protein [Pelagicoccus mobilis]MBK1876061.1 endonuclease/exonuclease/phosphatase family protein [Pelagicoccus mobilis]
MKLPTTHFPILVSTLLVSLFANLALSEAKDHKSLKVVNWNVQYGFNHRESIEQGAHWLTTQEPDIVGLQELNGLTSESLRSISKKWGHNYSAILKQKGFPVGLTSKKPIEVIERRVEGFHHGYLHCKSNGIHFFVVHFWPHKDHEADIILKKARSLLNQGESVVVMGDFNTNSEKDAEYLAGRDSVEPIYEVVKAFESKGFVDLVHKHDKHAKYSHPSPKIMPRWAKTMSEVESKRQRIDFVFADNSLANFSRSGTILTSDELGEISDHYPIVVELTAPLD